LNIPSPSNKLISPDDVGETDDLEIDAEQSEIAETLIDDASWKEYGVHRMLLLPTSIDKIIFIVISFIFYTVNKINNKDIDGDGYFELYYLFCG
jgi:hypothetical protein